MEDEKTHYGWYSSLAHERVHDLFEYEKADGTGHVCVTSAGTSATTAPTVFGDEVCLGTVGKFVARHAGDRNIMVIRL